jgi:HEAT repeat protein
MKRFLRLLAATGALLVLVHWSWAVEFKSGTAPPTSQPSDKAKAEKPKTEKPAPATTGKPDENQPKLSDIVEKKIAPMVADMLQDRDGYVRITAANLLENMKGNSVEALIGKLKSPEPKSRELAIVSLRRIGPDAADAVPALIERLHDQNVDVRAAAVFALRDIGPDAPAALDAIPVLAELLHDRDGMIRGAAAYSLIKLKYDSVPSVVSQLANSDPAVRTLAVQVLRYIGQDAEDAIPDLIQRLHDSDANVREAAVFALRDVGEDSAYAIDAIPALADLLADRDGMVRRSAAYSLIQFKADSVPDVIKMLRNKDANTRELAVNVLRYIGLDAMDAVPDLTERLKDSSPDVREAAVFALRDIVARAEIGSL